MCWSAMAGLLQCQQQKEGIVETEEGEQCRLFVSQMLDIAELCLLCLRPSRYTI